MTNTHMKQFLILLFAFCALQVWGWEREPIWPEGKMPDAQASQIAAMTDETKLPDFDPDKHRMPYLCDSCQFFCHQRA